MPHTVLRHPVSESRTGLVSRPWARWVDDVTRAALGGPPVEHDSGTAITLDAAAGTLHWVTLTDSATITITGLVDGAQLLVILEQDATGSRVPTWPADVRWPGGTEPTWSTTPGDVDVVWLLRLDGLGTAGVTLGWAYVTFTP